MCCFEFQYPSFKSFSIVMHLRYVNRANQIFLSSSLLFHSFNYSVVSDLIEIK